MSGIGTGVLLLGICQRREARQFNDQYMTYNVTSREGCRCDKNWFETCEFCKDTPRRNRQAEKDRMKAYSKTLQAARFNSALTEMSQMNLRDDEEVVIKYKKSKDKSRRKQETSIGGNASFASALVGAAVAALVKDESESSDGEEEWVMRRGPVVRN